MFPKASLLCASPIEIAKPNEWKFAIIILLTKEGKFQKAERRKIERSALFTKPRQQVYPPFRSEGDAEKMHVQEVDLSKSDLGMQIFFRGRKDHVIGRWTCYPRCPRLMIAIPAKRRMPPRLEEARHKRGILQRNGFSHPTGEKIIGLRLIYLDIMMRGKLSLNVFVLVNFFLIHWNDKCCYI